MGRARHAFAVTAVVLLLAVVVPVVGSSPSGAADAPPTLELRAEEQLSPRLSELRVFSPALERETSLRVLTPAGFDPARDELPVLWLLHGGVGDYTDWTDVGRAEELTEGLDLIVVMPDAGAGGWYSDWRVVETSQGPQRWETYHVRELKPFIEQRFGTRTDRAGHALAGLSMGGFGAMHHAARHPDLYGFAASFSGAVDILHPGVAAVTDISPLAMGGVPFQIWGNRMVTETNWRANNPVDLAPNLGTVETQLRTGNGMPGGRHGGGPDVQEIGVSQATATLHQRLADLGIAHLYDDYGPGAHTYDYWIDALEATLPRVVASAAEARPAPTTVDHLAFEPAFSVWGHDVVLDRPVLEEAVLSVRPDGFGLRGSGAGTVTTPARFTPGQAVRASTTTDGGQAAQADLVAGDDGRVVVPVDLGPANLVDQYPLDPLLPPRQTQVQVTLEPVTEPTGSSTADPSPSGASTAAPSLVATATATATSAGTGAPVADPLARTGGSSSPALALGLALVVVGLGLRQLLAVRDLSRFR